MKNKLKIQDFYFDTGVLTYHKNSYYNTTFEEKGEDWYQNTMFKMFSDFFEKFNHLPLIGHGFYLVKEDIHIYLGSYESHSDTSRIYIFFERIE